MATRVIGGLVTARQDMAEDDSISVLGTGAINSSTIGILGGSGNLNIFGSVYGAEGAISLGSRQNNIIVGASGSISGRTYGIKTGNPASPEGRANLNSSGTIYTETGSAISLHSAITTVMNSGFVASSRINGQINQAPVVELGGLVSALTNTGTIIAGTKFLPGIAVRINQQAVANDLGELHNQGFIQGSVHFGLGRDLYDGRSGYIDGAVYLGGGEDTFYGGAGDETVSAGAGNSLIDGGDGEDTLQFASGATDISIDLRIKKKQETGIGFFTALNVENIQAGAGHDQLIGNDSSNTLYGENGNDTLAGLSGDDTLNGGDGLDTALFSGSAAANVDLTKAGQAQDTGYGLDVLIGIENLEGGSGADWFRGDDNANVLTGRGGNDTLSGGLGNDTLEGGSGLNTAIFSGTASEFQITDNGNGTFTITGPDGTDLLQEMRLLRFTDKAVALWNTAPTSLSLSSAAVSEATLSGTIVAQLSALDADGDALTYSLAADSGPFRIDGTNLVLTGTLDFETKASHSLTVVAKDAYGGQMSQSFTFQVADAIEMTPFILTGTAGKDRLEGEAGNDVLTGLGSNDTLLGEAGNDRLSGGSGKDVLSGGFGQDIFVFDSRPNRTTNLDRITDFKVVDDTIHLKKSAFTKMAKKGVIKAGEFYQGTKAHDADDRIVYNKKTGALFYDADGIGSQAQIQIATLSKNLKMTHKDFFVV